MTPRLCLALILVASFASFASPRAQMQQPAPNAAISGVVVDGATGEPVAGAVVNLSASARVAATPRRQITDDNGRFAFLKLVAGPEYMITASKFGYFEGGYGREVAPTDPLRAIVLKDNDDWIGNLRAAIWQPGSISGVIRDEAGDPVVGVYVRAIARIRIAGHDEVAAGPLTYTDDLGAYRLPGLSPGRYVIQAPSVQASVPAATSLRSSPLDPADTPEGAVDIDETSRHVIGRYPLPPPPVNGQPMSYPMAFHPAAPMLANATTVDVGYGDNRSGVDVTISPVPAVRVSGRVDAPPDALAALTLRLLPAGLENLGQGAEVATAFVAADGRFVFLNVPAGSYTIDAPQRISEFVAPAAGSRSYFPVPPGRNGWSRATDTVDWIPGLVFVSTDFRGGAGANYSGRSAVTVGRSDISGVTVRLQANATMTGRVVLEAAEAARAAAPRPTSVVISLDPAEGEASLGMPRPRRPTLPDEDASFTIQNIAPGRFWFRAIAPTEQSFSDSGTLAILSRLADRPGWLVKSVLWKGRDYANEPFDAAGVEAFGDVVVTLTNAVPELSGSVRAAEDVPRDRAMVVVFPANAALWRNTGLRPARLKAALASTSGSYRMMSVPAGEYLVAAIDRSHASSWQETGFLTKLQRAATRVTLNWGATTAQDLTPVVIK